MASTEAWPTAGSGSEPESGIFLCLMKLIWGWSGTVQIESQWECHFEADTWFEGLVAFVEPESSGQHIHCQKESQSCGSPQCISAHAGPELHSQAYCANSSSSSSSRSGGGSVGGRGNRGDGASSSSSRAESELKAEDTARVRSELNAKNKAGTRSEVTIEDKAESEVMARGTLDELPPLHEEVSGGGRTAVQVWKSWGGRGTHTRQVLALLVQLKRELIRRRSTNDLSGARLVGGRLQAGGDVRRRPVVPEWGVWEADPMLAKQLSAVFAVLKKEAGGRKSELVLLEELLQGEAAAADGEGSLADSGHVREQKGMSDQVSDQTQLRATSAVPLSIPLEEGEGLMQPCFGHGDGEDDADSDRAFRKGVDGQGGPCGEGMDDEEASGRRAAVGRCTPGVGDGSVCRRLIRKMSSVLSELEEEDVEGKETVGEEAAMAVKPEVGHAEGEGQLAEKALVPEWACWEVDRKSQKQMSGVFLELKKERSRQKDDDELFRKLVLNQF